MTEYSASSAPVGRRPGWPRSSRTHPGQPQLGEGLGQISLGRRRATVSTGLTPPPPRPRGEEAEAVGRRAGERVDRVLRVRHHPHHVALGVAHPCDGGRRTVRVVSRVPDDDLPGRLEVRQRVRVGRIGALTALQRHHDLLAGRVAPRPRGVRVLHPQPQVPGDELQACVTRQRARQQVRLAQDLEPVADAEHRQPGPGGGHQLAHHRSEPRDGAAAQVVAIGKAAGQDHRVHAAQVAVPVPERHRLGPGRPDRPRRVPVIERPGKGYDPYPHAGSLSGRHDIWG